MFSMWSAKMPEQGAWNRQCRNGGHTSSTQLSMQSETRVYQMTGMQPCQEHALKYERWMLPMKMLQRMSLFP